MEQLRDIKGLVAVEDYSFYIFLGVLGVAIILLFMGAFLIYKYLTKKAPMSQKKLAIERLKKLKIENTKESIYAFSHLAQYAADDDQRLQKLLLALEPYKYRKEIPELDKGLLKEMQDFIKEVSHG